MGVAARLAVWRVDEEDDRGVKRFISQLQRASMGVWVGGLRTLDAWLAENRPGHPLSGALQNRSTPAWSALAAACENEGIVSPQIARGARRTTLGALELSVAYRNAILGHGVWRDHTFYASFGELWLAAAGELAAETGALRSGLPLAILKADGTPVPIDQLTQEPTGEGSLALVSGRGFLDLGPVVRWRSHPLLHRIQVGFLDKIVRRKGVVRRVEYLDYASGDHFQSTTDGMDALLKWMDEGLEPEEDTGDLALQEVIGRGATATVHLALQRSLGRRVAVKVLDAERADDPVAAQRFEREIQALARVDHPSVVRLLSAGQWKGSPSFAMEYVDGDDLAALSKRLGRPDTSRDGAHELGAPAEPRWREACRLFAEVADGVQALHDAGIVHRDIKPANILLPRSGGRLVLVDLGLARLTTSPDLTRDDGRILGTLRYMAPEQLQRGLMEVDHRVDIYSLCASLYELVTGRPPRDAETEALLVVQVLQTDVPPARSVAPWLPPELETVLSVGLSRDVQARYPTALDLASDLRAIVAGLPIAARPVNLRRRLSLAARRLRTPVLVAVAAVSTLAIAGAYQWDSRRLKSVHTTAVSFRHGGWVAAGVLAGDPGPTGFRVEARGGRAERISWTPGWREPGALPTLSIEPWPSSIEQDYDDDGNVVAVIWRDATGAEFWRVLVSHEATQVRWRYQTRHGLPMKGPSLSSEVGGLVGSWGDGGVYEIVWTLGESGWAERAIYYDLGGKSTMNDGLGVAGIAWERDAAGRPVRQHQLDLEGKSRRTLTLPASRSFRYDDAQWRPAQVVNGSGEVAGVAEIHREYDPYGRVTRTRWLDGAQDLVAPPLDEDLDAVRILTPPDLPGCGEVETTWSETGWLQGERCAFASEEHPKGAPDPVRQIAYVWDAGQPTLIIPKNSAGVWIPEGAYALEWESGMVVSDSRMNEQGKVVRLPGRPARQRVQRDTRGRVLATWSEDASGSALPMPSGRVRMQNEWDENGSRTSITYLGFNEQPASDANRVHRIKLEYDDLGRWIRTRYLGVDGQPTLRLAHRSPPQSATHEYERDSQDRIIGQRKFGADGRPFESEGWASMKRSFDADGFTETFFDDRSAPTRNRFGCYKWRATQEHGLTVGGACFDLEGEPAVTTQGLHREVFHFDSAGNRTMTEQFGVDGEPVSPFGRPHKISYEVDEAGRLLAMHATGHDGQPAFVLTEGHSRRATSGIRYVLTPAGRIAQLEHLGMSGEVIVRLNWTFDGWGRTTSFRRWSDTSLLPHVFHALEYRYDDRGFLAEIDANPVEGEPFTLRQEHDEDGILVAMDVLNAEGVPSEGRAVGLYTAQPPTPAAPIEMGMTVELPLRRTLGGASPLTTVFGRVELRSEPAVGEILANPDTPGKRLVLTRELAWFDRDRKPMAVLDVHRRELTWTDQGMIASVRTYGVHGEPVIGEYGGFLSEWQYDEAGYPTLWAIYGVDGLPTDSPDSGYAREEVTRNAAGFKVDIAQYRADNSLFHRDQFAYDDLGRVVSVSRHGDASGRLSVRWRRGSEPWVSFFGDDGVADTVEVRSAAGPLVRLAEIRFEAGRQIGVTPRGAEVSLELRDIAFLADYFEGSLSPFAGRL